MTQDVFFTTAILLVRVKALEAFMTQHFGECQIIESINAQGRIVSDALARLSALVADDLAAQLSAENV